MPSTTFTLRAEHIPLCNLLKVAGLTESGGAAKQAISQGLVFVDNAVETRKTAKIRAGQVVRYADETITVAGAPPVEQMPDTSA